MSRRIPVHAVHAIIAAGWIAAAAPFLPAQTLIPLDRDPPPAPGEAVDLVILGDGPVGRPLEQGEPILVPGGPGEKPSFRVDGRQAGIRIDETLHVTRATRLSWWWRKEAGPVCIVQVGLREDATGGTRYLGYAAGEWTEPPSADPTAEIFVSREAPRAWRREERPLLEDIEKVLGWRGARVTSFFLSPWDGNPGSFREAVITGLSPVDAEALARARELRRLSRAGTGSYEPLPLPRAGEKRPERFETSFEECAPGRASGSNEWSAFGAIGDREFNCMGRDLWVRYPAFDLVFRLFEDGKEVIPGDEASFRLGLVGDRFPGIWGAWERGGLLYRISAMTIPGLDPANFDLYRIDIQNPTAKALPSRLVAAVEGPPDLRLEGGVVRGLGGHPFAVAEPPGGARLVLRDQGLLDKRARAFAAPGGPGRTDPAVGSYRIGLDGLPVAYRFRAPPGGKAKVYLVSTPHASGHLVGRPEKSGDLVLEYRAEGCPPRTIDAVDWVRETGGPPTAGFDGAADADGDGFIEVSVRAAPSSRILEPRLSAIYVFPPDVRPERPEAVWSGDLNGRCLRRIDVGATPEQSWTNMDYDRSDLPLARLLLDHGGVVEPGATRTSWIRIPPVHRRQPASMGAVAHAFREVLPGEAVPPFDEGRVRALSAIDPAAAEGRFRSSWEEWFRRAARFDLPDRVLEDIFLSRLATRAILDVPLGEGLSFNACSPFFYFDHAYRDQAYVVRAYDLAGLHGEAEALLRAYCRDAGTVPPGPIAFDGKPLRLGMLPSGLWITRPGQWDTQGQNIWALAEHWKLSGDRRWLEETAYPYIRRGALWLVESRRRHMADIGDPADPRHGLLEPGAMEVLEVGKGTHMYYLNAFGVLGLREAAEAAGALGKEADAALFGEACRGLRESLGRSFEATFRRTGLYEGALHFGVEPEGVGMYGSWAHNCLLWPCRAIDPRDPKLTATLRRMEAMGDLWGGGLHSEGQGSYWPYIGVDRAMGCLLRGEPDRALDYFCAYTDTAGGTLSWGEGYSGRIAGGDQPHMWADAQWIHLFRSLFVFEDGKTLWLAPALFRRWNRGDRPIEAAGLPTHFGVVDLRVQPRSGGDRLEVRFRIAPRGDQASRPLERVLLFPRFPGARSLRRATVDGAPSMTFTRDCLIIPEPRRDGFIEVGLEAGE